MKPYVTLERFKTMGFGIDLDEVEDWEVRSALARASERVAALTSQALGHDFRGGTVTDERHQYPVPHYVGEEWKRQIWLLHRPIADVTQFRIYVTDTQYLDFSASELAVSPKFVDIVSLSLTTAGLFGTSAIPYIGLRQPQVRVSYTYGETMSVSDETFDPTDGRTFRGQNQWWTDDDVTVKVNDVVVSSGFTVDRAEGTITFDENQDENADVEVTYTFRLPSPIAQATGLLAAQALADREIRSRGMAGLTRLKVDEIELTRDKASAASDSAPVSQEVLDLLKGFEITWAGSGSSW